MSAKYLQTIMRTVTTVLTLSLLALIAASDLSAQVLTIRSLVTDQPLPYSTVSSRNPDFSAVADSRGRVDISGLTGADSIRISHIGYSPDVYSYQELKAGNFIVYLEEAPVSVEELVVSASRWEQPSRFIPARISILRSEKVELYNPQTSADMIGLSDEVLVQKSQLGGGSPMIRGFAANRVMIAVDGVRMNTAIFRSGNLQNVISIDPMTSQAAEIVFGPTSTMYGSDALGGVMNFRTTNPSFSTDEGVLITGSLALSLSTPSFEQSYHVDLNIGLPKITSLTSISYSDFDDLTMGSVGPMEYLRYERQVRVSGQDTVVANPDPETQEKSGFDQFFFTQKLAFHPSPTWQVQSAVYYSTSSDIPRYDRLIQRRNNRFKSAEWYYGPQTWLMTSLTAEHEHDNRWYDQGRFTFAYQHTEESRHDRDFDDVLLRHRYERVNAFIINLDFKKNLHQRHSLVYGTEVILNRVGSEAESENIETGQRHPLSTRYPDGSTWNSFALYGGHKLDLGTRWSLQFGLRYNVVTLTAEFDTTFFPFPFLEADLITRAITGNAGLVFAPDESWNLRANFSTGFRTPNIDDVGKVFDSEPGSVVVPNPGLSSEYAYSTELGVVRLFSDRASIDLSAYYTFLDDALVRRDFTFNGSDSIMYDGILSQVQAIQNAAYARVYGLHVGVEALLLPGLTLKSGMTIQEGEEELDNGSTTPLRHVGPWFGLTRLSCQLDRAAASLSFVYNGEVSFEDLAPSEKDKPYLYAVDKNGDPYSPSWWTMSFNSTFEINSALSLRAGAENILDKRYRTYSSGISAPGRSFMVALTYRW